MGAPRGDASVTRRRILAAARELFAARGVDGVSVREIAAALIGLASVQPMLTAGVGLEGADSAIVLERCVDVLVGFAAGGLGAGPGPG